MTKCTIDNAHCNPKAEWEKLGKPDLLTPKQVEEIKKKTKLKKEEQPFELQNGQTVIRLKLRTNDVLLLELK